MACNEETKKLPCNCSGLWPSPETEVRRINNDVRVPSSLKTSQLSTCIAKVNGCDKKDKDPKFASYDRVHMKRRAFSTKQ
jgi:hypothetical protein